MRRTLTTQTLVREAAKFAEAETTHNEPLLYGVTDGKAVGTYLEQKFVNYLKLKYSFAEETQRPESTFLRLVSISR